MPQRGSFKAPKLPKELLDQIGDSGGPSRKRGQQNRKDRRKAERQQKKSQRAQPRSRGVPQKPIEPEEDSAEDPFDQSDDEDIKFTAWPEAKAKDSAPLPSVPVHSAKSTSKPTKTTRDAKSKDNGEDKLDSGNTRRLSRATKDVLDEDDARIAELERKLGLKGKKKLPKAFEDEGLAELLEGVDDFGFGNGAAKRKRTEDDEWLQSKRQKATGVPHETTDSDQDTDSQDLEEEDEEEDGSEQDEGSLLEDSDNEDGIEAAPDEDDGFEGFDSEDLEDEESDQDVSSENEPARPVRENPYVPPVAARPSEGKYVPPSLRGPPTSDAEAVVRLRRQTQGLLNRLSEANMLSIVQDIEKLYQSNPRQYVTTTLIDLLLDLICDKASLLDTFLILHAGFIAAVYKLIGTDFGAQIVEHLVARFDKLYAVAEETGTKATNNLVSLASELYNFQVLGSNLVFDFIRLFLQELSEVNTELLLRLIRNSGPQLRHDDPSSLKDIVILLQKAAAKAGEQNLSVRTKFMIETINNLKNNRLKTGAAASAIVSEHTIRMKKTLGSLSSRNIKATEPLRVGLADLRDTEKRGKWWLVGASWNNPNKADGNRRDPTADIVRSAPVHDEGEIDQGTTDLLQLAREQRMNTDVRRAIFMTIMSATDFKDAYMRLMRLKLKRAQELEIPRVLIHCAGAEKNYNTYYTLIARRLCSEHKLKMAFQFGLWSLFKRLGEKGDDEEEADEEEETEDMSLRKLVNLARMYGNLIADGGLNITILKVLNFAYLQPKTTTFVEVLLVTVVQQLSSAKEEKIVADAFARAGDAPQMLTGLQYFMKKVVSKTDLVSSKAEKATFRWGCGVARDTLAVLASSAAVGKA